MVDVRTVEEIEVDDRTVAVGETDEGTYEASVIGSGLCTVNNAAVVSAEDKYTAVGKAVDEYMSIDE